MRHKNYPVYQLMYEQDSHVLTDGTFVPPTLIELPHLDDLEREVFGPVLHVMTYKNGHLETLLEQINAKGYGLTMGLHTRIDHTIQTVITKAEVGNLYINRNIVGAVVGVQPFGGEGLSGTGPKAGGPIYLYRLMQHCSHTHKKLAKPFATQKAMQVTENTIYPLFKAWVQNTFTQTEIIFPEAFCVGQSFELQGPTGEKNQYIVLPREKILSLADNEIDQIHQLFISYFCN